MCEGPGVLTGLIVGFCRWFVSNLHENIKNKCGICTIWAS
jgi:hypothetical protein